MPSTMLDYENEIIEGFLDWIDWRNSLPAPHPITIGSRKEGHQRHFVATATFPLVTVRATGRAPMEEVGIQRRVVTTIRVAIVMQMSVGDVIDEVTRQTTGKVVENILRSDKLGKDWITEIDFPRVDYESEFERWLRNNTDHTSGVLACSESDFTVDSYYVLS